MAGLLGGLWEFPSQIIPDGIDNSARTRKQEAQAFVRAFLGDHEARSAGKGIKRQDSMDKLRLRYVGELGSVPWLFSHLKLTMHVHLFELDAGHDQDGETIRSSDKKQARWASTKDVEEETMGTGMRQCWGLVSKAAR